MRRCNGMKSQILEDEGTSAAGVLKDEQVQAEGGDIPATAFEVQGFLDDGQTQTEEGDIATIDEAPRFPKTPTLGIYI
jgi:hypothetical protein